MTLFLISLSNTPFSKMSPRGCRAGQKRKHRPPSTPQRRVENGKFGSPSEIPETMQGCALNQTKEQTIVAPLIPNTACVDPNSGSLTPGIAGGGPGSASLAPSNAGVGATSASSATATPTNLSGPVINNKKEKTLVAPLKEEVDIEDEYIPVSSEGEVEDGTASYYSSDHDIF